VDPARSPFSREREVLLEDKYRRAAEGIPGQFTAKMGAEAIRSFSVASKWTNCPKSSAKKMKTDPSLQKRIKFAKRLKVLEAFRKSGNKPE